MTTALPSYTTSRDVTVKLDDGRPAYGKILSPKSYASCHTNATASLSEYDVSSAGIVCALIILLGV